MTKTFGGIVANRDITLAVEDGSITGLIGPNGSGKTTLFNSIVGYSPDRRRLDRFDGREISGLRVPEIARLGLMRTFQQTRVYGRMTCMQNMQVSTPHAGETVTAMFAKVAPEVNEEARAIARLRRPVRANGACVPATCRSVSRSCLSSRWR